MAEDILVNMTVNTKLLLLIMLFCNHASGWIHNLKLQTDDRRDIMLTHTFGFLKAGTLTVNVTMFSFRSAGNVTNQPFGFTLDKSKSPGFSSYMESLQKCALNDTDKTTNTVIFRFDFEKMKVVVERRGEDLRELSIVATPPPTKALPVEPDTNKVIKPEDKKSEKHEKTETGAVTKTETDSVSKTDNDKGSKGKTPTDEKKPGGETSKKHSEDSKEGGKSKDTKRALDGQNEDETHSRRKRAVESTVAAVTVDTKKPKEKRDDKPGKPVVAEKIYLNLTKIDTDKYQTFFQVNVAKESEEGLYNLYFHNCMNEKSLVDLSIQIIQKNEFSYLSADEMPIPVLYFVFSVTFFILTVVWFSVLRKANEGVYKIHYLMLVVVFFKSISNLFHGVNMHMIEKTGIHLDAWAILWYIVYLMRGAVLFVTVLLIGAGWAFIKHVFTDREKKLFLIVIPLQILMNVAWVIVEESEEGYSSYDTWNKIFTGVDLLCCFAILFPVIWSIRHLQEASKTDGKAAINLNKLKLFRHFYIMVVAYIYFTRIIGYLLLITLPFRYGWMKDLFEEVFLFFFFTLTGYKFRPTSDNPYLQVPLDSDDEEEIEIDEVVTKSGNTETVVRVNQGRAEAQNTTAMKQRESSHEYD
ncbi:unnamed protein product [Lymnaea stagnalis]|uniref:GOST seven transmembrane domain-containing protein n=1 Tax=Lymnaea stagnalis TaxID=6523 RepID=A0AAV2H9T6_LYMST